MKQAIGCAVIVIALTVLPVFFLAVMVLMPWLFPLGLAAALVWMLVVAICGDVERKHGQ